MGTEISRTVIDNISHEISGIEHKEDIRIIHAVESGSRAWGFASPDSDYDVRFIYVRSREYYLKLEKIRDVIELPIDGTLDISGWDVQKALRLLHSSNPTLFEWDASPIVYRTTGEWAAVRAIMSDYFSVKAGAYHYLNTANTNYRTYLKGSRVKLKKYFYVLRPILACRWVLDAKSPPPMLFIDLVESTLETDMRATVDDLLAVKQITPEMGEGNRIDKLNQYIDDNLSLLKAAVDNLPDERKTKWGRLNELFLRMIKSAEGRTL